MQEKVFIKNRKNQKVVVVVSNTEKPKGLAFIMHGLGGDKEELHIRAIGETFKENNFTVVWFDTTNTFGESDGNYADATVTNYYEDLEDVINWAKTQDWYTEPFWLAGHSLGGLSVSLYAEKYSEKVKCLAPISTVVSGEISLKSPQYDNNDLLTVWEKTGVRIIPSKSGKTKILKWSHMEDRLKYDLLPLVSKLTMPVLMIVGDEDQSTPLKHQQILYNKLPGKKELHVIKGSGHVFRTPEQLEELKAIFDKWIKNNL